MTELLGGFARGFPVVVFFSIVLILLTLFRAWSRMSSGSIGAGTPRVAEPVVPGLQLVPWDAVSVDASLESMPGEVVSLLLRRASALAIPVDVPHSAPTIVQVESILDQLEAHLDLHPLPIGVQFDPSAPPPSHPSQASQ